MSRQTHGLIFNMSSYLIRWRAWWFNKTPLSVTLILLLVDGRPLTWRSAIGLVLLVLTVCAVGNFGYALNDLYDLDEDARVGRANAAAALGPRRTGWIVAASAAAAVALAFAAGGWAGAGLTLAALALPLGYSLPPVRLKERKWLGLVADALAAHVFPALLALLVARRLELRAVSAALILALFAWSAAVGLRGILSHQLHTAERDRAAGLTTVVHDFGRGPLERFIIAGLLPIEVAGFVAAAALCDTGPTLWLLAASYFAYEAFKSLDGRFTVVALRPEGQPYIPFVEESFYKGWGPVVLALDAARIDLRFLVVLPLHALLYRPHFQAEVIRLRAVWSCLRTAAPAG